MNRYQEILDREDASLRDPGCVMFSTRECLSIPRGLKALILDAFEETGDTHDVVRFKDLKAHCDDEEPSTYKCMSDNKFTGMVIDAGFTKYKGKKRFGAAGVCRCVTNLRKRLVGDAMVPSASLLSGMTEEEKE